jgi:site-specific recombinase XerD
VHLTIIKKFVLYSPQIYPIFVLKEMLLITQNLSLEVRRAKHGHDSIHPLRSPELRALRQLQRDYPDTNYVFVSERKAPLSTRSVRHIIARAGELADLPFKVHPHQLRHACGYYLAAFGHDTRAIQDYLGHKNIHHTVRYTQMSPQRFENFWTD